MRSRIRFHCLPIPGTCEPNCPLVQRVGHLEVTVGLEFFATRCHLNFWSDTERFQIHSLRTTFVCTCQWWGHHALLNKALCRLRVRFELLSHRVVAQRNEMNFATNFREQKKNILCVRFYTKKSLADLVFALLLFGRCSRFHMYFFSFKFWLFCTL